MSMLHWIASLFGYRRQKRWSDLSPEEQAFLRRVAADIATMPIKIEKRI